MKVVLSAFLLFILFIQTNSDFMVHTAVQVKHSPNQEWKERTSSARLFSTTPTTPIMKTTMANVESISRHPDRMLSINLNSNYIKNSARRKELHDQPQLPVVYPQTFWNYRSHEKLPVDRNYQHDLSYSYANMNAFYNLPSWYNLRYRRYPREEPFSVYQENVQLPWNYKPKCRSCGRPLLQDSFCSDDFVMRVYIYKESVESNGQHHYLAYIYEVFKDTKQYMQPTRFRQIVYNCDRFQTGPVLGEIYLITGIYISNVAHVDSCSWKSPWSQVTKEQKRHLRKRYSLHCGICRLQRVLYVNPVHHRDPNTCYVPVSPNSNEMTCRDKFSICRLHRRTNRCSFANNRPYHICETWSAKHI